MPPSLEKSGYTEGPWSVGQHPALRSGWIVRPVLFGSRVRVLPRHEGGHVQLLNEADAHLIAAAPDLLKAAEAALKALIGTDRLLHRHGMMKGVECPAIAPLQAAIAKARGL